jgi:uncharacterized protein YcnI
MNIKKVFISSSVVLSLLLCASPAFAHVVVRPNQVGTAAFQTFTVGVPNEKEVPTVGLRLVIPEGLKYVSPNVKPGWTIDVKKSGEGEEAVVTEITWTSGKVPAGQRDDFVFSAQAPAEETSLQWKAYQTYESGEVVAWDQKPSSNHDDENVKPYSETKVVNDLASASEHAESHTANASTNDLPTTLSIIAIILSAGSLYIASRKKK